MKKRNFKRVLAGVVSLSMAMTAFGFVSNNGGLKDNMTVVQAAAQEKTVTWDSSVLSGIRLYRDGQKFEDSSNGVTVTWNNPNDHGMWDNNLIDLGDGAHPVFTCSTGVIKKIVFSAEVIFTDGIGAGWGDVEHSYTDDDRRLNILTWSGSSNSVSLACDEFGFMDNIYSIVFTIEEGGSGTGSGSGSGTPEESHDYNITDLVQEELTDFPAGNNRYWNDTDDVIYAYQSANGANWWLTTKEDVRLPVTIEDIVFTAKVGELANGQGFSFETTNQKYYIGDTPHTNTYTLTIPSEATASGAGFNEIGNIVISQADLGSKKKLVVKASGSDESHFVSTDDSITTKIGYTIDTATTNGSTPIPADGLSVSAAEANAGYTKTVGLNVKTTDFNNADDGTYRTTVTWTVKVDSVEN